MSIYNIKNLTPDSTSKSHDLLVLHHSNFEFNPLHHSQVLYSSQETIQVLQQTSEGFGVQGLWIPLYSFESPILWQILYLLQQLRGQCLYGEECFSELRYHTFKCSRYCLSHHLKYLTCKNILLAWFSVQFR